MGQRLTHLRGCGTCMHMCVLRDRSDQSLLLSTLCPATLILTQVATVAVGPSCQ